MGGITVNGQSLSRRVDDLPDEPISKETGEVLHEEIGKHKLYRHGATKNPSDQDSSEDKKHGPVKILSKGTIMREKHEEFREIFAVDMKKQGYIMALLLTGKPWTSFSLVEVLDAYMIEKTSRNSVSAFLSVVRKSQLSDELELQIIPPGPNSSSKRTQFRWTGGKLSVKDGMEFYRSTANARSKDQRADRLKKAEEIAAANVSTEEDKKEDKPINEKKPEGILNLNQPPYDKLTLHDLTKIFDDFGFDMQISIRRKPPRKEE